MPSQFQIHLNISRRMVLVVMILVVVVLTYNITYSAKPIPFGFTSFLPSFFLPMGITYSMLMRRGGTGDAIMRTEIIIITQGFMILIIAIGAAYNCAFGFFGKYFRLMCCHCDVEPLCHFCSYPFSSCCDRG